MCFLARARARVCVCVCSVCLQLSLGVAALFGPQSRVMSRHVDSICSRLEIPHVITASPADWSSTVVSNGQWRDDSLFSVSVHPAGGQLGRAYVDLVRLFGWIRFAVVYTSPRGEVSYAPFPLKRFKR